MNKNILLLIRIEEIWTEVYEDNYIKEDTTALMAFESKEQILDYLKKDCIGILKEDRNYNTALNEDKYEIMFEEKEENVINIALKNKNLENNVFELSDLGDFDYEYGDLYNFHYLIQKIELKTTED